MAKTSKVVSAILAVLLCFMLVVSIADTGESKQSTNFNQETMLTHIEKLSENGPRSLVDKESNEKALKYIVSQIESYGVVNQDTTDTPAYMIQDYVATHDTGRYQNFYLQNLIVHIPANAEITTGEAIMFMGHFDSVPMGDGASDDGVACATMLEAIRYYLDKMQNGYTISNDLVFCFVNGEEYNLYGSEAFMNEFKGFDNVVDRINFGTNLESRGTDGTLIMFETADNNYNTIKLFSEVNKNIFTCSIATMIYDMMPNGTDFSNFKEAYQGLNMANINGGENYHTQNDNLENISESYLSQQAQIVDTLIEKLGNYDLNKLYEANESAIFFSYLNVTTVVYNHTTVIILGIIVILLVALNIILSVKSKNKNLKKTAKAILAVLCGFILTAGITYLCYYIFQFIASLTGAIDFNMIGTITYSNVAIVLGIGIIALAVSVITTHFACKWLKIECRDITRAFAYIHAFLGAVISFALADASYLFVFSGIMLMINELLITSIKKTDFSKFHFDLLATALYFPIVIPIIFLATSALGMTMAYVYGLVFALAIFNVGVAVTPIAKYISIKSVISAIRKKEINTSPACGGISIMAVAMIIFLAVCFIKPNANVNLQGKQSIPMLAYDDALVYASNINGNKEYRICDLNAYSALKKYAPEMDYNGEYYAGQGDNPDIKLKALGTISENVLNVKKNTDDSLVHLNFKNINAESFTVNDGITTQTYKFDQSEIYTIILHSDCNVTLNGGNADVEYIEVLRDYNALIPSEYDNENEKLHFNLWLTAEFSL